MRLPTPDATRAPHLVTLHLTLRGRRLSGWASAISATEPARFLLSSYVELTRQIGKPQP